MKQIISKRLGPFPAAHRQHNHVGHCSQIHGHNWYITPSFSAEVLDTNGFIFDFGKLSGVKEYLKELLDHTFLVNETDPMLPIFQEMEKKQLVFSIRVVPNGSSESLAHYIGQVIDGMISNQTGGRVRLHSIKVEEDEINNAEVFFRE
jgi:6-pyruvoyltetrahydropterin/6-carboxytetrahydropterin synthase